MPENCMHLQKAYGYEIIREKSLHPAPWIKKDQPLSSLFIVQKKPANVEIYQISTYPIACLRWVNMVLSKWQSQNIMIIMKISDQNFENIMIFCDKKIFDSRSHSRQGITNKANNTAVPGHKSFRQ